jgi:hypothetical protein
MKVGFGLITILVTCHLLFSYNFGKIVNLLLHIIFWPCILFICWLVLGALRVVKPKEYGRQKFGYAKNLIEGSLWLLYKNGYTLEPRANNYDAEYGCSFEFYQHRSPNQSYKIHIKVWYEEDYVWVCVEQGYHEGHGSIEKVTKNEFRYKYNAQAHSLVEARVTKELLENGYLHLKQ